jgi:hypothetical protein
MPNPQSPQFRYIYSNVLKAQYNGAELMLTLGVRMDPTAPEEEYYEEAVIIMSAQSAKMWGLTINSLVESAEKVSGQQIKIDEDKLKQLAATIKSAEENAMRDFTAQGGVPTIKSP